MSPLKRVQHDVCELIRRTRTFSSTRIFAPFSKTQDYELSYQSIFSVDSLLLKRRGKNLVTEAFLLAIKFCFFLIFEPSVFAPEYWTSTPLSTLPHSRQKSLLSCVRPQCSCASFFFAPFARWRRLRLLSAPRSAAPLLYSPASPARPK